MINLLLNIQTYQNNNKNYAIIEKFQLKTPPMHGEMKKTNCIRW